MVNQHYRWDFVALSTDTKPTPETSEKVTDGSTYYCSDTSKLYIWCKDNWYEKVVEGGGGASNFNDLTNRPKYNGTDMTGATDIPEVKDVNEYTIKGAGTPTTSTVGTIGLLYEDTTNGKLYQCTAIDTTDPNAPVYTWSEVGGGSGPSVVQTAGTSTTDVMSQNAVSTLLFKDPLTMRRVAIGDSVQATKNVCTAVGGYAYSTGWASVAISGGGNITRASGDEAVSIGDTASATANYSIALGSYSSASNQGEMNVGLSSLGSGHGYNNSNYRLISGVYDGQGLHDAATVAQGNTLATSAPTTSTEGVLGQLYTDTTNIHTYQCTAIDTTDPDNPSYTWTQRW